MALTKIDDRGLKYPINLLDDEKIKLGTGNDLVMYHTASNNSSYIQNITGTLYIESSNDIELRKKGSTEKSLRVIPDGAVELYYDNSQKFATNNGGIKVYGSVDANGSIFSTADNTFFKLGASNDLLLTHNGTDSYIRHATGSGQLQLRSREIHFLKSDATDSMAKFIQDGAVELYYDNNKKFETTSTGVTVTGTVTATAFSGGGIIPSGGIIIWSGASNAIPTGFLLCDGSNSTPDLRDRFIVGAGSTYSVGATGGANSVTLTTAQIPSHNHSIQVRTGTDDNNFNFNQGFSSDAPNDGGTFNSNSTGGGQSHENRPPYYALCYIMKS